MTEKIIYVAENGATFEDRMECLSYEAEVDKVKEAVRVIKGYCAKYGRFSDKCGGCPYNKFCDRDFYPAHWDVKDEPDLECILGSEFDDVLDEEDI